MEEAEVKKEMGKRLVDAMEPEDAKRVLLEIVSGIDPYVAILGGGREDIPVAKKKRKAWTRKVRPMQNVPPMVRADL